MYEYTSVTTWANIGRFISLQYVFVNRLNRQILEKARIFYLAGAKSIISKSDPIDAGCAIVEQGPELVMPKRGVEGIIVINRVGHNLAITWCNFAYSKS
ncbi:MAG: hypothetical protein DWQ07_22760 [Chloroflexi bacterium]|nr:MAG: hypothetical protein DWQ07_22760 [Chloroflexota bacterium]MBL1193971.1 hypothetical protein [Chloroflexota bacterium]